MKLLAAVVLLGTVAVSSSTSLNTNKEFIYKFTSQVLTGIPQLNRQYAGLRIRAEARIQAFPDMTLRVKLQNARYMNYNDKLRLNDELEILSEEEFEVPANFKTFLEAPFKAVLDRNGVFHQIHTEAGEPEFVTNLKKALFKGSLSMFPNEELAQMIHTNTIQRNAKEMRTTFRTMETSVLGKCEVEYNVNKLTKVLAIEFENREMNKEIAKACQGKDYYEVIKTKNFKKCKERPIFQQAYGARQRSDGSLGGTAPHLHESSVERTIRCGTPEDAIYRKTTVVSKYLASPTGKFDSSEKVEVIARLTYALKAIVPKKEEITDVATAKQSKSLVFEFPAENYWTSVTSGKLEVKDFQKKQATMIPQLPLPDMEKVRKSLFAHPVDAEKTKQLFAETFVKFLDVAKQSPESSHAAKDVNGQVLHLTKLALTLSYADVQDLWTKINAKLHHDLAHKQDAMHVFLDVLSIAATNPCVKYISEKVKAQAVKGEPAAWIVANMIKSVKTPTEEVILELTNLLKHANVINDKHLRATVAMALTELVHKACVDETSAVHDYPARIFGRFCTKDSRAIKKNLIPFLVKMLREQKDKLQQPQIPTTAMNAAVVYINALGNLGIEEAAEVLLEVAEGKMTDHPHPRSLAVYKLMRFVKRNPVVFRPILFAIIHNAAEHEEVRMAAISVLPYAMPGAADLQKLAIRTWFEPSKQVTSYITTLLKSLKDLPMHAAMNKVIIKQAAEAFKHAKPVNLGIQTSHNIKILQFLDTLKAGVALDLQWVNAEDSAFPRTMYARSAVRSKSLKMETFESAVYLQGAEVLLEKMYDMYKMFQKKQQPSIQQHSMFTIKNRIGRQPEAHVTLKMLGLHRLFSIDHQLIQDIIAQLMEEYVKDNQSNGIKKDFLKVLDLSGLHDIIPTEAGLPLMVQHRTPIVIAAHASLMMVKKGEVEIKIKPVVNYKQTTLVGVFCPFTQKFLGAGVDTSLHVAVPLRVGVALKHGQFAITLKTPEDAESQKVKPVIELKVLPFTAKKTLPDSVILDKTDEVKTIHTHYEKKVKELQLGDKLGVDLKLRIESEHKFVDLANFFLELRQHQLLTLINLPLPFRTARAHSVSLIYNPMTSIAKEATFVFGLGYGRKTSANDKPMMIYPTYQKDPEIEKQCKYNDAQNEKQQECLRKMFCSKEKETCHTELKKQNKPAGEVTKYCTWKHAQCNQRHFIRQNTRHVLSKLGAGTALTLNAIALVQGDNLNVLRKVETHFTLGHKPGHHKAGEKSAIKLMAGLVTAPDAKPFDFDIDAAINVVRPINKWDKEAILLQDPKADVTVNAQFGWRGEEKKAVIANVKALQSVDQKTFAKESDAAKKCEADNAKGRKLTKYCKQARARASSLDVVEAEINLPVVFSRHPLVKTLVEVVKVLYFPYLTILPAQQPAQQMKGFDKLVVRAKINQLGKRMSLNIFTPEQHIEAKHIRLGNKLHDLLPFNTKENMLINVVQKLTAHGAPSVCAVEGGKVRTFDKVEYEYTLNDCEHVIFKDCSPANTVEVTVKKNTNIHLVKLFLDNNKYELELMRSARAARTVIAVVRVNGEKKQFVELAENFFVDENTYITSYEDGVFAIVSKLYGLSIFADIDRVEVRTFQHRWRNQACGLCGDLNDEKTADLKSAGNCIMSDPKLAAFSYMVADNKCQGMPDKYKTMYQTEAAKCIKKKLVPTKVTEIFKQKQFPTMRHIVDVKTHKVCISTTRVNVCKPLTIPKEIIGKKVAFFCLPRDAKGETLRRVAERGGRIENAKMFPNKYIKEVAQPIKC